MLAFELGSICTNFAHDGKQVIEKTTSYGGNHKVCKTSYTGSTPVRASKLTLLKSSLRC